MQPDAIAAVSDAPVVRAELGYGDVLLTHPTVLRRHRPGTYDGGRCSIEGLAIGSAWCPKDAHPLWW